MPCGREECVAKAAEYRLRARNERGKARDMLIDLARYWETLAERKAVSTPPCGIDAERKRPVHIHEHY
jgi:hypothetical protein